ncbi:MAG: hypothetical protein OEO19_02675 [Gammaproteobacteria bacterium]|nr:hypothetical protein [Gammaproteobacteria bacterium]
MALLRQESSRYPTRPSPRPGRSSPRKRGSPYGGTALPKRRIPDELRICEASPSPAGKMARYRVDADTSFQDEVQAIQVDKPTRHGDLHDLERKQINDGLYGMGPGWNNLPAGRDRGAASFHGGIRGFQSCPLAVAPQIIDQLVKSGTMEAIN